MNVNVRVLGAPLILALEEAEQPENSHRAGTVPIVFHNGVTSKIRVFGHIPYKPTATFRYAFERELRRVCENVEIWGQIYNRNLGSLVAHRFNPSMIQRTRGW